MTARILEPNPEAVAELSGLRHREMLTISNRLGRITKQPWDRWFGSVALVFVGALIGGLVALVPFLATHPSREAKDYYFIVLCVAFVVAAVCTVARFAVSKTKEESVTAIRDDLDLILGAYSLGVLPSSQPLPVAVRVGSSDQRVLTNGQGGGERSDTQKLRSLFRELKGDVVAAARTVEAAQSSEHWWSSRESLQEAKWKKNRVRISELAGTGDLYDTLRDAFNHVARLNGARAMRSITGSRQVRATDRLPEAAASLRSAASVLERELEKLG